MKRFTGTRPRLLLEAAYGCCHATTAELSGCDGDLLTCEPQIFTLQPSTGKVCRPLLQKMDFRVVYVLPPPYPRVFTSSVINFYQYNSWISVLCCGCHPILSLLWLLLKVFQIWPLGVPLGWFLHSFNMPAIFFEHIFTPNKTRCSSLCYFSRPQPWDCPFSKESWFLSLKNGALKTTIWLLNKFIATEVPLLPELLQMELDNIYVC